MQGPRHTEVAGEVRGDAIAPHLSYSGKRIHENAQGPGLKQPVDSWDPVSSPSGMTDERVVGKERLLKLTPR